MSAESGFTQGAVTSQDGTRIGFRRIGRGPGLVLVQGAMGTERNYHELAQGLASGYTVFLPDRRGRGMSAKPYAADHWIARDVEDVDAVLAEAAADQVFGLSSGAMIALEAARTLPRITRAAVYEPPFYTGGAPRDRIARFNAEGRGGRSCIRAGHRRQNRRARAAAGQDASEAGRAIAHERADPPGRQAG